MKNRIYIMSLLVVSSISNVSAVEALQPPVGPYVSNQIESKKDLAAPFSRGGVGSLYQQPEWVTQRDNEIRELIKKQNEIIQAQHDQQMERNRQYEEIIRQHQQQIQEHFEKNRMFMQPQLAQRNVEPSDGKAANDNNANRNFQFQNPGQPPIYHPGFGRPAYGQFPVYPVPQHRGIPANRWR